jgi:hypothetical protein
MEGGFEMTLACRYLIMKLTVIAAIEKLLGSTCYLLPQAVPTGTL